MFERTPVTIVKLRPYLDRVRVLDTLTGEAGAMIGRALLEPEGAEAGSTPPELRGALAFHRTRLKLSRAPAPPRARTPRRAPARASGLWEEFTAELSKLLPKLNDALIAEALAALERRQARARGESVSPCQSRFAARWIESRNTRLDALGTLDLRAPSWAETPPVDLPEPALDAPGCATRGRFREWYRITLGHLQPIFRTYAQRAAERGVLQDADDAYFIPFELGHSLGADKAPSWLEGSVASNRAEFEVEWKSRDVPPERLEVGAPQLAQLGRRPDWTFAPLGLLD